MRLSLQFRLLSATLLAEILVVVGLLMVGRHVLEQQLVLAMDSALAGRAMSVAALVRFSEDQPSTLIFDRGLAPSALDSRFVDAYEVLGPEGNILGRSDYWPRELGSVTNVPAGFWTAGRQGRELHGIRLDGVPILDAETGTPISKEHLTVFYATPTHRLKESLSSTTVIVASAAVVMLILTAVLSIWFVRRSMRPLHNLAAESGNISVLRWQFEPTAEAERIPELRPLVRSLRLMLERLRGAFESQSDFISNAAHELKTPISIQKSSLQLLLHHDLSVSEYKRGIEQALQDTERIEQLLQRMLKLARAEYSAGTDSFSRLDSVSIAGSCEMAMALMRPYAESRGAVLRLDSQTDACVKADIDDLILIWTNLLENAIRYSHSGGEVSMKVSVSANCVTVDICDTGCGIEHDQLDRIFERFYRGDQSRARDTGGVGLGLAMVKVLVERYRGTVHAESGKDRGATLVVALPLDDSADQS